MKRILSIVTVVFLASCAGKSTDKKSELEKLRKERTELNTRITALEAEIGTVGAPAAPKEVTVMDLSETSFKNFVEIQGKVDAEENVQVTPE
ncbi:MAG TPA: hypothetical protein VLZ28_07315, partial [Daejeonella sp.]|nr:hypothetical protein [Daejeonella sp.]